MTSFWDMNQSEPSSGTHTAAECSESEPQRDGSPTCGCTKETSGCSIHPNTRDEWIASMQASLAKILAALEIKPESAKAREADFTGKCYELLTSFDPDTCSWKTSQRSLLTDSWEPFSETWPRWGYLRDGAAYELPMQEDNTTGIDGGYWPTPRASLGTNGICWSRAESGDHKYQLEDFLAHLYVRAGGNRISGLQIHPSFCEKMMRWPVGWSALRLSETGKTPYKPRSRGRS